MHLFHFLMIFSIVFPKEKLLRMIITLMVLFQGIEESFFEEYLSSISIEEEKAKNLGIPGKTIGDAMGGRAKRK